METELIAALGLMVAGLLWLGWVVVDAWRNRALGEVEEDFTGTYLSDHPNKDRSWQ